MKIPIRKGNQTNPLFGFPLVTDETLPPPYAKAIIDGRAIVFHIDHENEVAQAVAEWPER